MSLITSQGARLLRFEDERVKMVLDRFSLLASLRRLLDDHERRRSARCLAFESFNAAFPTFPVLLAARYSSHVADHCAPADLFRSFQKTFLMTSYLEVYAANESRVCGRPIGVVVPFAGFRGGMIVHNGEIETGATRLMHMLEGDVPPHRLTVEPFDGFLKFLAKAVEWSPDVDHAPRNLKSAVSQDSKERSLSAAMVKKLGVGPALIVFAWLRDALRSSSSGVPVTFIGRDASGDRYVEASHAEIAAETGLSERQVKRGIRELRSEEMISTEKVQKGSRVWLLDRC